MRKHWFDRHVAERLVEEDREPSSAEDRHLTGCASCYGAVRRGRSFDRQLRSAVVSSPAVALPPEVLTMPMPSIRRPPAPSPTSLAIIASLAVAVGLVAWSVLPGADAGASATPSPETDPHLVVAGDATWRISLAGRTIEIYRSVHGQGAGPSEDLLASWDLGDFINGGASTTLRCPRTDGSWQWAVLGHQNDLLPLTFRGPPAAWTWAPDGLWLAILDANAGEPTGRAEMHGQDGRVVAGVSHFAAESTDIRQQSGCFLAG